MNSIKAQTQLYGWVSCISFEKLSPHFSIECDASFHGTNEWNHAQSFQQWLGLLYYFNPHWNIGLGYSIELKRESVGTKTGYPPEHQVWEQLLVSYPVQMGSTLHPRRANLLQRMRLEDRFIPEAIEDGNSVKAAGRIFSTRLRYLVRNQVPILSSPTFRKGPYVVVQDEIFFNTSGKEKLNVKFFDQNRSFAGSGYRFSEHLDLEFGYLFQYSETRTSIAKNNVLHMAALVHL